jgi:hypothetical protein
MLTDRHASQDEHGFGRFCAFISYSHRDKRLAARLHQRLENYRLPRRLRAKGVGAAPDGRLGRIFRDREDLPAAGDLTEAVRAALASSDALIVLCSPDSAQSSYVDLEIRLFRELHPGCPIFSAILHGAPEAVMPAALRIENEPLAADLRREGDGRKLGFLKIVAGLAQVPLDALVQREAQRQLRRVMAVTGIAFAAVLILSAMTIFALQSRNEARVQKAAAEGLVEYMLTDLRDRLRGVGRLDVMTAVNERAMDYYESQGDLNDLPATSLERRARILLAMGEDDSNRGELTLAADKFVQAHRVTGTLLAREPGNSNRIFAHGQSEYWLGFVAFRQEQWAKAKQYWQGYKRLADRLVRLQPGKLAWLREVSSAQSNLCAIEVKLATHFTNAIKQCREALIAAKNIAIQQPKDDDVQSALANRHAWLAGAFIAANDRRKAAAHFAAQDAILSRLAQDNPRDNRLSEQLMRSAMVMADNFLAMRDMKSAKRYASRAAANADRLIAADPANQTWQGYHQQITKLGAQLGEKL